jgi:lysophosphatidate acyltransferase
MSDPTDPEPVDSPNRVWLRVTSLFKLIVGWASLLVSAVFLGTALILLLPSRTARIRACNYWGHIMGPYYIWLSGCEFEVTGREHLDRNRSAIYISNHTSVLDIMIAIRLSPVGTVGVAKKEIMYYPVFGQLYYLSGHLRIDRANAKRSVASLAGLADLVKRKRLSIFIWAEGTRSRDGRLLPLKKGFAHLAMQTGLPVVAMVVQGAHKCWEKRTHTINSVPVSVEVLPPIETTHWTPENIDEALEEVHAKIRAALPADQLPLASVDAD